MFLIDCDLRCCHSMSLQVGGEVTLADIAVAAALQPLLASVLSSAARSAYPGVIQWFVSLSGTQSFAKILGELCIQRKGLFSGFRLRANLQGHEVPINIFLLYHL